MIDVTLHSFAGDDAVKIIIKLQFAVDETGAIAFGNELIKNGMLENAVNSKAFKNEDQWYRFVDASYKPPSDIHGVPSEFRDPITNVCEISLCSFLSKMCKEIMAHRE